MSNRSIIGVALNNELNFYVKKPQNLQMLIGFYNGAHMANCLYGDAYQTENSIQFHQKKKKKIIITTYN